MLLSQKPILAGVAVEGVVAGHDCFAGESFHDGEAGNLLSGNEDLCRVTNRLSLKTVAYLHCARACVCVIADIC